MNEGELQPRPTIGSMLRDEVAALRSGDTAKRLADRARTAARKVKIVPVSLNEHVYEKVFESAVAKLGDLLEIDIPEGVVAAAWSRYHELAEIGRAHV